MASPRDTHLGTPAETLTLKAAAAYAGVSVSTVRRRKDSLIAAGATVSPSGWVIPLTALEAVFVAPNERTHDTPLDTPFDSPLVEQLRAENARLWEQVEQQARTIERQSEAHAVIAAQLTRLGPIEAGTAADKEATSKATTRRWWQRKTAQ